MLFRRTNPVLRWAALGAALAIVIPASGCADDTDATSGSGSGGSAGVSTGSGPGALAPPVLLEVAPFALSLRITWEAPSTSMCDAIEGERRTAVLDYTSAFEVPGADTIYVDEGATADQTYTYRVRCKVGDALSAYSNEKTGNPMKF